MLINSLPHHAPLFTSRQTPLSRIRLEQRLSMLEDGDAVLLRRIEHLIQWDYLAMDLSDEQIVRLARVLVEEVPQPPLQEVLDWRMEMRTALAALRRRHRGEPAPRANEVWGYGRWVGQIQRYWGDPTFGLDHPFPWLRAAHELLRAGDSMGLERLLLELSWNQLERVSGGHYFDFVAVVIYVLKWDIVARWTSYDGARALGRFNDLVADGLQGHEAIFA
jgi:hypothetical protein